MIDINEKYMKRCYELAISAGKKGFHTKNSANFRLSSCQLKKKSSINSELRLFDVASHIYITIPNDKFILI